MTRYPGVRRFKRAPVEPIQWKAEEQVLSAAEEEFERQYLEWNRGTRPEFIVWRYLVYRKHQVEGTDFIFQSSQFGGKRLFGGVVIDFWLLNLNMVWRVQGERFHKLEVADRVDDMAERLQMEQRGYVVVDLWVEDLNTRASYVLDLAWQGQEVPSRDV
jgi:hypothetical protein